MVLSGAVRAQKGRIFVAPYHVVFDVCSVSSFILTKTKNNKEA